VTPSRPAQDNTEYKKRKGRKRFGKRAVIEATISHLKQDFCLGRCIPKGEVGDQIYVLPTSTAYNPIKIDPVQAGNLFLISFAKHSKTCPVGT
jgi:hypothetical protein